MSSTTREINKITTTIIRISVKLMVCALIILLFYEAVARGFAFGHEIFYAESVDEAPGRDVTVVMEKGQSASEVAKLLTDEGLIKNRFAFLFQSKFYDCETFYAGTYTLNTSMTSKEILQLLNEKPEDAAEEIRAMEEPQVKAAPVSAGSVVGESSVETLSDNERIYDGEEGQIEVGGWIQDAAGEGNE